MCFEKLEVFVKHYINERLQTFDESRWLLYLLTLGLRMFLGTAISLNKCLPLILLSISEAAFFSKRLQMSHICPLRHFALVLSVFYQIG